MKSIILKVFFFVKYNIESFPVWGRILAATVLAFVCYTSTVFVVNFLDDILADHRVSLFFATAFAVNLAVSPLMQRIARNLKVLGRKIISEDNNFTTLMNPPTAATAGTGSHPWSLDEVGEILGEDFSDIPEEDFLD